MPMTDYPDFPCPICNKPMTDVDGMWECQNSPETWHCYSQWVTDENILILNLKEYLNHKSKQEVNR